MASRVLDRHIVEERVECRIGGVEHSLLLYDLSASGCMLEVPWLPVAVGDRVEVDFGCPETAEGEIVWQQQGCAGVRFSAPLQEAIILHLGFSPTEIGVEDRFPNSGL